MKVWVVCQNDFPSAVFASQEAAQAFCDRQPKKSINGHPIYWHVHAFTLDEGK